MLDIHKSYRFFLNRLYKTLSKRSRIRKLSILLLCIKIELQSLRFKIFFFFVFISFFVKRFLCYGFVLFYVFYIVYHQLYRHQVSVSTFESYQAMIVQTQFLLNVYLQSRIGWGHQRLRRVLDERRSSGATARRVCKLGTRVRPIILLLVRNIN